MAVSDNKSKDKLNSLDQLIALGKQTGFSDSGTAEKNKGTPEKTEPLVVKAGEGSAATQVAKPKASGKQKTEKPDTASEINTSLINDIARLSADAHPWMTAASDIEKPFMTQIPLDLKLFLDGVARAIPGQSMKSILVYLLERDLPELAKVLNLPIPDRLNKE